ncbi:IS110 family transposase, partial [Bradyrhizobium sp. UFLA 03-164]|nr:IS110 family transposase [Bradyrhizobium uaiense]
MAQFAQAGVTPALARECSVVLGREDARRGGALEPIEPNILAWRRADPLGRRLAQIPSVGPIVATALVMKA